MKKLRIGVVGLGGIAQKAWLPVLAAASDWMLQGAWSPTRAKALPICESWRIPYADSLSSLAASCDAVFVHSSTASTRPPRARCSARAKAARSSGSAASG